MMQAIGMSDRQLQKMLLQRDCSIHWEPFSYPSVQEACSDTVRFLHGKECKHSQYPNISLSVYRGRNCNCYAGYCTGIIGFDAWKIGEAGISDRENPVP